MTHIHTHTKRIKGIPAVLRAQVHGPYTLEGLRDPNTLARSLTDDGLHRIFRLRDRATAMRFDGLIHHSERYLERTIRDHRVQSPLEVYVEDAPHPQVILRSKDLLLRHGDALFYQGIVFSLGDAASILYEERGSRHTIGLAPKAQITLIRYVAEDA